MRKKFVLGGFVLLCAFIAFINCTHKVTLPKDPIVFEIDESDEVTLLWNNKEYVCCGIFTGDKLVGKCLGYYKDYTDEKILVCELKSQSSDEWLVDTLALDNCNEGSIYKEKSVSVAPDSIKEYID